MGQPISAGYIIKMNHSIGNIGAQISIIARPFRFISSSGIKKELVLATKMELDEMIPARMVKLPTMWLTVSE